MVLPLNNYDWDNKTGDYNTKIEHEDTMNEIFIRCACGTEGINITTDEDTGEVFFAMMYTDPCRMSAMDKLRWIIQILRGKPYPDQIVITRGWLPLLIDHLKAMQIKER